VPMFESITTTAIVESARPVIEAIRAQEASIVAQLWREYPLLMLAGAVIGAYTFLKPIFAPARSRRRSRRRRV